jgi:hypothetical protein
MTAHQKKGPWHMVSSSIKYQNPWITVREDKVIRGGSVATILKAVEFIDKRTI